MIARTAIALLLATLAVAGCRRDADDTKQASSGEPTAGVAQSKADLEAPLAIVDGVEITVGDLQEQINNQSPYLRPRYKSQAKQKEFLQTMIRFELLAKEAEKRGFDEDPDVVRAMKQVMIQKLMEDEFENKLNPSSIPEAEIKAYFEEHPGEFNRPEQVRISAIILDDAGKAKQIAAKAKGDAGSTTKKFRALVVEHSVDEASKKRGGDLQYLAKGDTTVPEEVIDAAFQLRRTGEVKGPIEADGRYYIIKQTGKKKAQSKDFESVERSIRNRLYRERRAAAQRKFIDDLRSSANIEINQDNLDKVQIDTSKPSKTFEQDGHNH